MIDPSSVLVQACLNGNRRPGEHHALPLTPAELARDARSVVAAGAAALHVHPRGADRLETIDPAECAAALDAIRAACPDVPIGLTTGAWIEPDPDHRLTIVGDWSVRPDFVSVNFSGPGAARLCALLSRLDIGVEAGIWTVADAHTLIASGLADRCLRLLVEIDRETDPRTAVAEASAIDAVLDEAGIACPRLHHGAGLATWAVIEAALDRGHDIRVGLEDTLQLPDGRRARNSTELVDIVVALVRQHGHRPVRLDGSHSSRRAGRRYPA